MEMYIAEKIREQAERLEREARQFLAMGYELDELQIVCLPDGYQEISPRSALDEL
jgi:hypothetical protein